METDFAKLLLGDRFSHPRLGSIRRFSWKSGEVLLEMDLLVRDDLVKAEVLARGTADFLIRRIDPAIIMGGPDIAIFRDHELLRDPSLQCIPGWDGDVYDPPRTFCVLILDRGYVIAERFEVVKWDKMGV